MKGIAFGKFVLPLVVATLGMGLASTTAHALLLTPADADWTSNQTSACNAACVTSITGISGLTLLYKADVGNSSNPATVESGGLANSYTTTFQNSALDPEDFTLKYDGGAYAICPECILVVKDGNHSPAQYFFNLGDAPIWNGKETIEGKDFWPNGGAISHVAIFGKATSVPEPTALLLLGAGLAGIGILRRKLA